MYTMKRKAHIITPIVNDPHVSIRAMARNPRRMANQSSPSKTQRIIDLTFEIINCRGCRHPAPRAVSPLCGIIFISSL